MPTPAISIIIPCLRPPPHFFITLEDLIRNAPEGTEIIISDGGGLDTSRLPQTPSLRCFSEPDSGQAEAINKGIRRSRGALVGYLNADDLLFPDALSRVLEMFSQGRGIQVIYGLGIHIDESGNWLEDYPTQPWDYATLKNRNFLCQPAVFWRRQIHDVCGYFDEDLHFALDYDFWLRLGERYPFHYLENTYLAKSRLHSEAKTIKFPKQAKWENLVVKQRYNESVDTPSAFEYCTLRAREIIQERKDSAQFAELFLAGMDEVESNFRLQDVRAWRIARSEMIEMAMLPRKPNPRPPRKAKMLIDFTLFQPGGVHGGIKPALYSLCRELIHTRETDLVLAIHPKLIEEAQSTFGSTVEFAICTPQTTADDLRKDFELDVIFCPLPSLSLWHSDIPLLFLSPDLLHIDYPDSLTEEDREYRSRLLKDATEKADLFLTVSKFSRDRLMAAYNVPHRKVWVLPHALPKGRFKKSRPSDNSPASYFLYPANFWVHKNHRTLLVAFLNYVQHTEHPWKLILTGHPDSGNSEEVMRLTRTLGLEHHVDYLGFLSGTDYETVWAEAGALVFPSNYEGFGLPLLEAMECGLPILASNLPSLREVAGSAALYVDQHSPQEISKALKQISEDAPLRAKLIEQGFERSRAFNWREPAEQLSNLVTNLLTLKRRNAS